MPGILLLDILHSAASLNTADSKSAGIDKAAYYSRLPLQGTLHRLVELGRIAQVHDVDVSICGSDDKKVVSGIHSVDAFLALQGSDRIWCAEVPVFDSLVPRTGG